MTRFSRIDILVNNAATNPYFGPVLGAELSAWDKTFEVNLRGIFILTKLVYEASMEHHGGGLVNGSRIRRLPAGPCPGGFKHSAGQGSLFTPPVPLRPCGPV